MNWVPLLVLAALAGGLGAVLWFIGLLRMSRRAPRPPSPSPKKSEP